MRNVNQGHPNAFVLVLLTALSLLLGASGCGVLGNSSKRQADPTGTIIGIARDMDSQDPIAFATVELRAHGEFRSSVTKTSDRGLYDYSKLAPGLYTLSATFAGQVIDVSNINVVKGEAIAVDLTFTLGRPDPIKITFGNAEDSTIVRYRARKAAANTGIIEGTLTDNANRSRIVGAVISVILDGNNTAADQMISDDQGRFRFEGLAPGNYALSSYYAIPGRGQMELRRSNLLLAAGEGIIVPLWVDVSR
jgi:uncharacterized surface anchored protein